MKKFKKSKYRKLKISLLLQTVLITALTVLVGGFLLEYIIDGVYNDDVSEIFIGFLKFFHVEEQHAIALYWQILGNNKTFFMMIGFLALFALFFYIALSKMITLPFPGADPSDSGTGADRDKAEQYQVYAGAAGA